MVLALALLILPAPTSVAPSVGGGCSPTLTCASVAISQAGGCGSNGCVGSYLASGEVSAITSPVIGTLDLTVGDIEAHDVCVGLENGDAVGVSCGLSATIKTHPAQECEAVVSADSPPGPWAAVAEC